MPNLSDKTKVAWIGISLMVLGAILMLVWSLMALRSDEPTEVPYSPSPTKVPDLLIPTRTPTSSPTLTLIPTATPSDTSISDNHSPSATPTDTSISDNHTSTATPTVDLSVVTKITVTHTTSPLEPSATPLLPTSTVAVATSTVSPPQQSFHIPIADRYRLGISLPYGVNKQYNLEALGVGWVMDWNSYNNPNVPTGIEFVQTVSMKYGQLRPDVATLSAIAANRRGSTWLMSNEPDVRWQDNITPETYARLYHEAYNAIISYDSTAMVAAGGIAQPSQLRFDYLDRILSAYQSMYGASMPVQAWHIHNYMLREERDTWGVDIPPGISAEQGILYSVDDSGNLAAFKSQIYEFRRWMVNRGYGGLPLIVSEFGIPMPPDYGFELQRVSEFLRESWRFFYTTTDPVIGYPADGGRLVQRWCWFSLGVEEYPAGNLLYPPAGDWTPLASVWREMVER